MYAKMMYIQMSVDSGCMKLNTENSCFSGFLIMIEMPVVIKGFEKSTTRSRSSKLILFILILEHIDSAKYRKKKAGKYCSGQIKCSSVEK